MEAAEETLTTYRDDDTLLLLHRKKKLLPEDKKTDSIESNYVDLDIMKPEGAAKTVKVTFTGEEENQQNRQLSVIKCDFDGSKSGEHGEEEEGEIMSEDFVEEQLEDRLPESPLESKLPGLDHVCSESDELQYTDMYLNSRTEESEDDGDGDAVLSGSDTDHTDTVEEDESHYITTHEIQLTELDHDVDLYDLGRGGTTCWDFEDDNLVYSFVDYASFESDENETREEGTLIVEGSRRREKAKKSGAVVSTEQEEDSDLCDSLDESLCNKNHSGEIHLSIKTSSRVNEPAGLLDNRARGNNNAKHHGDGSSHFSFVSSSGLSRVGPQYFIPAPGRQHLASKLRRKDINEYSSGASSSISELDDADKEVRNLTAKSFRSLACPYFDAINLSTSSESSMSEYGLKNNWSAYVDWNYGNISMNKSEEDKSRRHGKSVKAPLTKVYALNKRAASQESSSSSRNVDPVQPKQRGVTLNFRCNVEAPEGTRRPPTRCSKTARCNEVTGTVLARSAGCEMQYQHTQTDSTGGDTHNRAVFASSLLKNVISKKMQFEQERKMERGEIRDTHPPALSPVSFQCKDQGRGLQRQTSESSSGFTVNSGDDQQSLEGSSRPGSCAPAESNKDDPEKGQQEPPKTSLIHSESSAFNSVREDEPEPVKEAEPTKGLDTNSMLTKLLFVPSYQLLSKEKDFTEDSSSCAPVTGPPAGPQKCEKEFKTGNNGHIVDTDENEKGGKTPGIKICLRSVKENKGCTLNIANMLTPKISLNTVNTIRAARDAKCHVLSAADKMPNFTVRDIRDTKCKFATPIYQVRDVRKLVKSSYRFVSLDHSESKCSTAADKPEVTKAPVKHVLPSPIVIKCHSVKTNVKQQTAEVSEASQSENTPSHCTASRVPLAVSKHLHPDQPDNQPNTETKLTKQRQEKFACEPKIPKQAALEKLKAAVKTMEQLYVFDRNEWKRKTQAPQPITDSHVLSLIASEEQGAEEMEATNTDRAPQSQEYRGALNIIHVPYSDDTFKTQSQQTFSNKRVLHLGNKAISSVSPQSSALQTSSTMRSSKAPVAPLSVKIESPKHSQVEQGKVKIIPANPTVAQACSDSENYLTIPGLAYTNEVKLLNPEPGVTGDRKTPEQQRSPLMMEHPAASVYHRLGARTGPQAQQQVLCFPPSVPAVSPTPSTGEAAPQTQRKMLLDPTTGHYYLVDTPIQATTKRLFDPETGQFLDVPMPHSPVTSVTPVPLSLSPLALSPGAFTPTYMIYPGFIPSPTLPAQAVLPPSPCHPDDAGGEKVKNPRSPKPETGSESAYYSATAEAPLQLPVSLGHVTARGGRASSDRKPVISITTQQGPRIIAPPSFDGTTMSFVVEHR
ncbi:uncharacterized protein C4orf54 homolog [Sebastes fasciatus]|uniref:uncharacterized protein C4orf54 homolog n=1 Tax=Sebastes fasciatus TaxID=394691 RepID=UPI003D9EDFF2